LQDINRTLDSKQNEFNLTKSLVENLEGFPESIKFLKKKTGLLAKSPLLSDIVMVEPEFKAAIENFLDPYMNYFILTDAGQAMQAIEKLKESKNGRSHFFLLDRFKNLDTKLEIPKGATAALSVVKVDKEYQDLIRYLLGNVLLVDANTFSFDENQTWIALEKTGEFIRRPNSVSGGSVGMFDGKRIGRAKNLEVLQVEMEELEGKRATLKEEIEKCSQQLKTAKDELQALNQKKTQFQNEASRINNQYLSLKAKSEQVNQLLTGYQTRRADLARQLEDLKALMKQDLDTGVNITDLRLKKEEIQQSLIEKQNSLQQLNEEVNIASQSYNAQNIQFVQQQNKLSTVIRELSYKKNLLEQTLQNIARNSEDLDRIKAQMKENLMENEGDSNLIEMYEEKESLEQAVNELERLYYGSKGKIDEQDQVIRDLRKRKESNTAVAQQIKDRITEIKIQLNSLQERLRVEFELEIESIMDKNPEADWNELEMRDKLNKIKATISNYGPINPMAVEAYNEIKERYDFIIAQKKDLDDAKLSLMATISEIDLTAKEKYLDAYHQIRANFIKVFRSLFTEDDSCDLVLSDLENPLDGDINIFAQPKGKRPQSLSQLSSGEKTLTATALLFGVYLLKPAPFCIFDEVDAPLDDANVDKFSKIIKSFSDETQFIVITHNKRTMSHTEMIYGITMVEQGVTQAVPVDMREVA
jgi:chromosome segregation protein